MYSLCQKPVLGLVLYVTTACAFPALFRDAALPLQQADTRVVREFEAPVSKSYSLIMNFEFPSREALARDEVVGSYHPQCDGNRAAILPAHRAQLGRPIPIQVLIRDKRTGTVVVDKVFDTWCKTSAGGLVKTRTAGRFALAAGDYVADVRNLAGQPRLDGVKTTVALVTGGAK
jgi:hypothetical protein